MHDRVHDTVAQSLSKLGRKLALERESIVHVVGVEIGRRDRHDLHFVTQLFEFTGHLIGTCHGEDSATRSKLQLHR